MIIKIDVAAKRARLVGEPVLVCGNTDYTIEFTFDAEWDDLPEKTARFAWTTPTGLQYTDVSFTGSSVAVPVLTGIREVLVGVFGGNLRATTPVRIPCEYSVRCVI